MIGKLRKLKVIRKMRKLLKVRKHVKRYIEKINIKKLEL